MCIQSHPVNDLESCVKLINSTFSSLEWDAIHEAAYNYTGTVNEELREIEIKYWRGTRWCRDYLENSCNLKTFCHGLIDIGLGEYLHSLKEFLPHEYLQEFNLNNEE